MEGIRHTLQNHGTDPSPEVDWYPGTNCTEAPYGVCIGAQDDPAALKQAVSAAQSAAQVVLLLNLQSVTPCDRFPDFPVNPREVDTRCSYGANPNPDPNWEVEARCGYEAEQHDRFDTGLPPPQEELALAVLAACRRAGVPVAVVLVHGGALAIEGIKDGADAILDAHYPGLATAITTTVRVTMTMTMTMTISLAHCPGAAEGGRAVAEALYGITNPGGKLTYTVMPRSFPNTSYFPSMSMSAYPGRTYKYYPSQPDLPAPLWKFGFGLSYTSFELTCQVAQPSTHTHTHTQTHH